VPESQEKVFIKAITVTGVTLISEKELRKIIQPYEGKELSVKDMQKVADLITDAYRKKGYVTSRAYIPPQKIENQTLELRVMEGITGNIDVKGNKYFKTQILKKKIALKKGRPFNYETLRKGLSSINQVPDRNAKAVLMPGKEPGTTDIVLDVKDRLPVHVGFDWDNFGSRYIEKDRLKTTITHNNILGLDDILALQYQLADAENYVLVTGRYQLPVNQKLKVGFFAAKSRLKLGREFEDLNARSKGQTYSVYANQSLMDTQNMALLLNLGFDYKDAFNFQLGQETSRDRLRVAKGGLDFDISDKYGRTFITGELSHGIPDFMGSLKETDARASRTGAGGEFTKNTINLVRLNRMPFNSMLLSKNFMQTTSDTLTATEQFQIGGIANVRGYPAAEAVGDEGYSSTWEWSFPAYFVPKSIKVPKSSAKLYDSLRFVGFYDWANARIKTPQVGEGKHKTLRGLGCGIRFNLPENFSFRTEFAWPLDQTPSDGHHEHTWFEISKTF
jgi:hemolysin activation/secretion protein